jgi:hypothetical protein
MSHMYCQAGKYYAVILRGTNVVSEVFQGANRNVLALPALRRVIEIPEGITVAVGDMYDGEFKKTKEEQTPQERAIAVSGQALQDRKIQRLAKANPVEALLIKGGLKT